MCDCRGESSHPIPGRAKLHTHLKNRTKAFFFRGAAEFAVMSSSPGMLIAAEEEFCKTLASIAQPRKCAIEVVLIIMCCSYLNVCLDGNHEDSSLPISSRNILDMHDGRSSKLVTNQ